MWSKADHIQWDMLKRMSVDDVIDLACDMGVTLSDLIPE